MNILVGETILHYEQKGQGSQDILILHGWGRSLNEWIPTAQKISSQHTVTLLDLPGFGSSEEPPTPWDTYDYALLVLAFMKKLEISSPIILGHSFGGRIATILAVNNSDQISSIILVDAGGIQIQHLSIKLRILFYKIFIKPLKAIVPKRVRNMFGSSDYKTLSGTLRTSFVKIVNQDLRHLFSKISKPVTVIWGSNDQVLPVEYVKIYKQLIPHAQVRIVWGADHSPHLSRSADFIKIIEEILL
jgi:pimeloyl-ACP methyl ester carboxylesterase